MSTELANATFERSCENSDVENETDTNASFPRQNLAGGCGVFANFFEEMAESQSYSASTNPQVLASLQATPDVVKLMDMVGLHEQQEPSTSEDNNPMHAYYNENSNDDLKLMQQYQLFVAGCNQSLPYSENECQLDYSTMTDLLVPVDRCVTTFTPPDLSNQLCVPYMHRNKIPKILANRFLLGETIGRGSYGKDHFMHEQQSASPLSLLSNRFNQQNLSVGYGYSASHSFDTIFHRNPHTFHDTWSHLRRFPISHLIRCDFSFTITTTGVDDFICN